MACVMPHNPPKQRQFGGRPFADVGNRMHSPRCDITLAGTPGTLIKPPMYRARTRSPTQRSAVPQTVAVPFPTISEDAIDDEPFIYDSEAEAARGREWAQEIAKRHENIKELRDRKIRLEQAQASRTRKPSPPTRTTKSYLSSLDRKLNADELDFIASLHASVVWRLWHADLSPDVFASERLLATRLHLVLMRYGRKNIPVPPIVAVNKSHHLMQSFATRHMMQKDHPEVQTLPQLVAKSLLRQGRSRSRSHPKAGTLAARKAKEEHNPSPLSREPISPL